MLLELNDVSKSFGGVAALTGVSFGVKQGEVFGVIGPNGAGKTTLFNLITGVFPASSGEIVFDGMSVVGIKPHRTVEMGIARTCLLYTSQGFRWSWLSLTGHGEDKTHSYGAVTFGKTPTGEAYKFFVKPELSLMESSGKAVLIAKPSIMALNGETAHILIGERIPVIEESEVNGERKRSTRYEEVGIKLNYTPIITADGGVAVSYTHLFRYS